MLSLLSLPGAAQEPPARGDGEAAKAPLVGTFLLDSGYPRSSEWPNSRLNFGVIVQEVPLPQETVFFLFDRGSDVFEEARRRGKFIMAFMGPCESMRDHPAYGFQRIGAPTEPVDGNALLLRSIGIDRDKVKAGSIFVPVLRNLRLYEPRKNRIGYEWLARAEVVIGGKMFGGRRLIDVDLSDHARFTYE